MRYILVPLCGYGFGYGFGLDIWVGRKIPETDIGFIKDRIMKRRFISKLSKTLFKFLNNFFKLYN